MILFGSYFNARPLISHYLLGDFNCHRWIGFALTLKVSPKLLHVTLLVLGSVVLPTAPPSTHLLSWTSFNKDCFIHKNFFRISREERLSNDPGIQRKFTQGAIVTTFTQYLSELSLSNGKPYSSIPILIPIFLAALLCPDFLISATLLERRLCLTLLLPRPRRRSQHLHVV